jgi:hypothetical protein
MITYWINLDQPRLTHQIRDLVMNSIEFNNFILKKLFYLII